MNRPIVKDTFFLMQKSRPATKEDLAAAEDLRDTLAANRDRCVGMAANMIGISRRIIVFLDDGKIQTMLNPVILKKSIPFDTEEGCLSLDGIRPVRRYRSIRVQWENENGQRRVKNFTGWTAQIIQHECDHLEGILI